MMTLYSAEDVAKELLLYDVFSDTRHMQKDMYEKITFKYKLI